MNTLQTFNFEKHEVFPSPTGVNYYEYIFHYYTTEVICFRPQQGLTIMNESAKKFKRWVTSECFRPQQGLTIMNSLRSQMSSVYECNLVSVPNRG